MMALSSGPAQALIGDASLQGLKVIGSGGFGQIYKARHLQWCCDVAIKLLHYDDGSGSSLLHEVTMMRQASNPHVIQVLGVYKGQLLNPGASTRLGLVMEFMERGSLASLQDTLCGPPPWPLAFRLAHQVALGINFLHNLSPAVLHLDLKPSNVLLDSSLNAKLTDFGLARLYQSVTRGSKKDSEEEAGTISYMPPEAFDISYKPTKASDIYSYGILLWSIVAGKQPYENALSSMVRVCIPNGDRPSLAEIKGEAAGLQTLVELMKRCWVPTASQRPRSLACTSETEKLYESYKPAISLAVHEVLAKLDLKEEERRMTYRLAEVHVSQPPASLRVEAVHALTGPLPIQEMAGGLTANQRDKMSEKDVSDQPTARPVNVCIDPARSSPKAKRSSAHHGDSSASSPVPETPKPKDGAAKPPRAPHLLPGYQRQVSNPENLLHHPRHAAVSLQLTNVIGFQYGNNNYMCVTDTAERKRHPTAPSSVNRSGGFKDEAGQIG